MKLTQEQRLAVESNGHAVVVACPGSGKTRAIIARLLRCIDEVRGSSRRVACITYTNAAVHEIESRIGKAGGAGDTESLDVATIHSFCQNNILRSFHWLLPQFPNGVEVLPSDANEYRAIADEVGGRHGLDYFARESFESLNRKPDGEPITTLPKAAAIDFWNCLEARGYVDFCNLVYYSFRVLAENPHLVRGLSAKYAHVLVDEFQDTSALQVELLSLIADVGRTTFFLVGDPEQSIYRFAGAERELMDTFAKKISASEFPLSGNFRCSGPIVERAELLIRREPTMFSAGSAAAFSEAPICHHVESHFAGVTDHFLPVLDGLKIPIGDAAILAPVWYQLTPLARRLRGYGIPVVGPGARPYKKSSHLIAGLAEQVCAYIESPGAVPIRQIERELSALLQTATGRSGFQAYDFAGRRAITRILREAADIRQSSEGAIRWLIAASGAIAEILCDESLLTGPSALLIAESAQSMIDDMRKQDDVDIENMTTSDLGMFANPVANLKLMTMHGSKGREFSAVAIIGAHDGRVPYHNKYNPLSEEGLAESRRLMYVAVTRAKRVLMLFTDGGDWRPPSRFLTVMKLHIA